MRRGGAGFLDFAAHGGHLHNATARNINKNLAPGGLETTTATYNSWYASPEIAYGYRFGLGGGWAVTPVVRVRYVGASLDGYTESGSTANLTVGARSIHNVEKRGEARLTHTTVFAPRDTLTWSFHGGVLGIQRLGDTTVNTVLLGANLPFVTPGKNSVGGAFGGLGFGWRAQNVTWFAAADYLAMADSSCVISGKAGIRVAF